MDLKVEGKKYLPLLGELTPDILKTVFKDLVPSGSSSGQAGKLASSLKLPPRPPSLCPGCPHRTVFGVLNKLGLTVSGDIGCYTLGVLPPFSAMDTCVEMGGSIGVAQGMEAALGDKYQHNTVAVIGDSTFAHSGITGLLNAAYNRHNSLIIVLDNGTTAMTGMQPNPLSGETITGEPALRLDYLKLADAMGIAKENTQIVDAYNRQAVTDAITALLQKKSLCFLIVQGPCMLLKKKKKKG
jgi:indolepyruvate ferredoxin oxidoreductase alpha subunit